MHRNCMINLRQYLKHVHYTRKCATCINHVLLKRMLNVRLMHGKHVNRVMHVKRTFIDARFTYMQ